MVFCLLAQVRSLFKFACLCKNLNNCAKLRGWTKSCGSKSLWMEPLLWQFTNPVSFSSVSHNCPGHTSHGPDLWCFSHARRSIPRPPGISMSVCKRLPPGWMGGCRGPALEFGGCTWIIAPGVAGGLCGNDFKSHKRNASPRSAPSYYPFGDIPPGARV